MYFYKCSVFSCILWGVGVGGWGWVGVWMEWVWSLCDGYRGKLKYVLVWEVCYYLSY